MSRNKKIILGILTFLPYLSVFGFFFLFIFGILGIAAIDESALRNDESGNPSIIFLSGLGILLFLFFTMSLLSIVMLIYYIIHAITDKESNDTQKLLWILALFFSGGIGTMIYWFMRIWRGINIEMD
jgi:4-amino-4-deoxy-L-arabinose transferase-like glycosyltransferase